MKKIGLILASCTVMTRVSACGGNENGNGQNPLLGEWTTPYGVPPFDQIKTSDYLPAFKEAMKQHNEEIEAIVSSKETPTFENTILAYDNAGDQLGRIASTFCSVPDADTDHELQKVKDTSASLLSAPSDGPIPKTTRSPSTQAASETTDTLD
mgnify:CR=1 FL=1